MHVDHGSKDATSEEKWTVRGSTNGRRILELVFYLDGTSDTGDTIAWSELARQTVNHFGDSPLDAIVSNVRPYEMVALNRYLTKDEYSSFAEAGDTLATWGIPMDILPFLKPELVNCLDLDDEHRLEVENAAGSDDLASGTIYLDETYLVSRAQAAYLPRFRRYSHNLADGEAHYFPRNTVYVVIAPATTTAPTQIRFFQGDRRIEKGSWAELLRRTSRKQGLNLDATHVIFDVTEKGRDYAARRNRIHMEMDGGSGTMEVMYVTADDVPDHLVNTLQSEKLVAAEHAKISLKQGATKEVVKETTLPVQQSAPVPRPKQEKINQERMFGTRIT